MAEKVKMGLDKYRQEFEFAISERHWRRLYDRAVARDHAEKDWTRLELYVRECLPSKNRAASSNHLAADYRQLRAKMSSFKEIARPTAKETEEFWFQVFEFFDDQISQGKPEIKIKHGLLSFLLSSAPFLAGTKNALNLKFYRRLERWREQDGSPEAIKDGRVNSGFRLGNVALILDRAGQ